MGNTPQPQQPQFDPNAAYTNPPQNLPADATHFYDPQTKAIHPTPEQPAFDPNATYQPAPEKPGVLSRAWQAAKDETGAIASSVGSLVKGAVSEPEDINEVAAHTGGGQAGLVAYRLAKGVVDSTEKLVKAKKENFHQAARDLQSAVNNFHQKNYGSALADTASATAGVMSLSGDPVPEMGRARDIAQGTKPGGDMVTPITKDAVDLGAALAMEKAPEVGGKIVGKAGDALDAAKGKISDADIIDRFKKRPETPAAQHGTPARVEAPLDGPTVGKQLGGKDLSQEALDALKEHVGDKIPAGSSAKNMLVKSVEPVITKINALSSEMNKVVQKAPKFTTSVAQDSVFGEGRLNDQFEQLKKDLPASERVKLSADADSVLEDADRILNSHDPAEVLEYRRQLGRKIDWDSIEKNPSTPAEVQNAARAKVYQHLTQKIHADIPETVPLDKQLQPNLELRSHLLKKVGDRLVDDPIAATNEAEAEHRKGKTTVENSLHNERADKYWLALKAAVGGAIGVEGVKKLLGF